MNDHTTAAAIRTFTPFKRWNAMMARCYQKGKKKGPYEYYGARGVKVAKKWHTFSGFWKDMKNGYFDGASLDRINNEKGYSKENCRWVTDEEQRRNKKGMLRFVYKGQLLTLHDLCILSGLKRDTLYARLVRYKWPIAKSITYQPINGRK